MCGLSWTNSQYNHRHGYLFVCSERTNPEITLVVCGYSELCDNRGYPHGEKGRPVALLDTHTDHRQLKLASEYAKIDCPKPTHHNVGGLGKILIEKLNKCIASVGNR